jgi:hypothetical protein
MWRCRDQRPRCSCTDDVRGLVGQARQQRGTGPAAGLTMLVQPGNVRGGVQKVVPVQERLPYAGIVRDAGGRPVVDKAHAAPGLEEAVGHRDCEEQGSAVGHRRAAELQAVHGGDPGQDASVAGKRPRRGLVALLRVNEMLPHPNTLTATANSLGGLKVGSPSSTSSPTRNSLDKAHSVSGSCSGLGARLAARLGVLRCGASCVFSKICVTSRPAAARMIADPPGWLGMNSVRSYTYDRAPGVTAWPGRRSYHEALPFRAPRTCLARGVARRELGRCDLADTAGRRAASQASSRSGGVVRLSLRLVKGPSRAQATWRTGGCGGRRGQLACPRSRCPGRSQLDDAEDEPLAARRDTAW